MSNWLFLVAGLIKSNHNIIFNFSNKHKIKLYIFGITYDMYRYTSDTYPTKTSKYSIFLSMLSKLVLSIHDVLFRSVFRPFCDNSNVS